MILIFGMKFKNNTQLIKLFNYKDDNNKTPKTFNIIHFLTSIYFLIISKIILLIESQVLYFSRIFFLNAIRNDKCFCCFFNFLFIKRIEWKIHFNCLSQYKYKRTTLKRIKQDWIMPNISYLAFFYIFISPRIFALEFWRKFKNAFGIRID